MRRRLLALALASGAILAGCGALSPYPTAPRGPQSGQPAGPRVAICYNTLTTPLAAVQAEAQRECPAETAAAPVETDWHLQHCPLLLPARASFVCLAAK